LDAQGRQKGYFGFIAPDGTLEESFETVLAQHEDDCNDVLVCAKYDTFIGPLALAKISLSTPRCCTRVRHSVALLPRKTLRPSLLN
jgi:hypothetical protein